MATKAQLTSRVEALEKAYKLESQERIDLEKQLKQEQDKATAVDMLLSSESANAERHQQRANELNQLLQFIANLCEHRSMVSYNVGLFDCDADGNRLSVSEEVRFLREIHNICNANEIPF